MMSTMCNIWDKFCAWVSSWSQVVYIMVLCVLAILALINILGFLKGNKYNKDKKPFKWMSLVFTLILFGIIIVLYIAKI